MRSKLADWARRPPQTYATEVTTHTNATHAQPRTGTRSTQPLLALAPRLYLNVRMVKRESLLLNRQLIFPVQQTDFCDVAQSLVSVQLKRPAVIRRLWLHRCGSERSRHTDERLDVYCHGCHLSLGRRSNLFALTPGAPQICAPRAMPMKNYRGSSLVGLPR